jgi:hypothetical protein
LIAKHISMRSVRKSSFAELVAYITDTQGNVERLEHVNIANCRRADVQWAIREVRSTQQQNTRAESDKTYHHLLIGFPAGEIPTPEMLQAIEQRVCSALGYGDHQRVSAVHNDTDNLHIHVAINKIHPNRLTMHEPYRDYKILGEICAKLENEYNLQRVNHGARKQGAQNRADDMEHMAGVESLIGWVKRECLGQIYGVQTWSDFHELMQANGLEIRERGNGFVIGDRSGTNVKASSIARDLSKTKREAGRQSHRQQQGPGADRDQLKKPFHELVAENLIEQLKHGTAPWQKPWEPGDPSSLIPVNPTPGKRYKGINAIHLMAQGLGDQRWMTYNQAAALGAQVRKGERGTPIQYWKFTEERTKTDERGNPFLDEDGKPVKEKFELERPRVFFATVFNAQQIDGLSSSA